MRKVAIAALVVLVILAAGCNRASEQGLYPGDSPPEIALPTLNGESTLKLSELKGKVVLVNFWASWCGACVSELPSMERLYSRLKDKGLVILAIGIDDQAESLSEFQRKFGLTFPVVVDKDGEVKARYKLSGVPESFVVDRAGKLLMFPDPEDGVPAVRIVGPREWDSPDSAARFEAVLK